MTFTYEGRKYRVSFKHDPSRRWLDHQGPQHVLVFRRRPRDNRAGDTISSGPAVLWCASCGVQLSHLTKAMQRRNVHCTIWIDAGGDESSTSTKPQQFWAVCTVGSSQLNLKAGDRYEREKGRLAALGAALKHQPRPFREALGDWFRGERKAKAKAVATR